MKKNTPKIVILGGGPTGLGAGWRLHELGYDNFVIYEREAYVGGLATSFVDDAGYTWDVGGHVIHSHYGYFDRMIATTLQSQFYTHTRESWIYLLEQFIPYPFQNNIHRLPPAIRDICLTGLEDAAKHSSANSKNFAEWIEKTYGSGIGKYFLYPYNQKVWAYPPEQMSFQWVGDRVARVDISCIKKSIQKNQDDVSWGPNAVFHFPKTGGTGAIWRSAAANFNGNIRLNKRVTSVDYKKKIIQFSDGSEDSYDELLSTMPLDTLVGICKLPADVSTLHHSSVTIVGLGFDGSAPESLATKCWIYFPESQFPFFRATVFSHYSPTNAPKDHWSLMTEVSSSRYRAKPKDPTKSVVESLAHFRMRGVSLKPVHTWEFTSGYGYPTPTLGRDAVVHKILPLLEDFHIYSRGRFGAWKYEVSNQDHSFMQGVEWVNRVVNGADELTLFHPELVNANK